MRFVVGGALWSLVLFSAAPLAAQTPPLDELQRLWSGSSLSGDDVERFYEHFGSCQNLVARLRAHQHLARRGDKEDYARLWRRTVQPRDPFAEEERALLTSCWSLLGDGTHLTRVRGKAKRAKDPWLDYHLLQSVCRLEGSGDLCAQALDPKAHVTLRVAALAALAKVAPREAQSLVPQLLDALDGLSRDEERLLLETCLAVPSSPAVRAALDAYAARPEASAQAQQLLTPSQQDQGGTRTRPRFMGATSAFGERVVFVIDLSDSMLLPLNALEREALQRVPTGTQPLPVPWSAIHTRLDAVRAFLERALLDLDPRAQYAVVGFGSDARTLESTPRLVKASKKRVRATVAELRSLRAGPPKPGFTTGTLWGDTNLHRGVRLAFQLTTGKPLEPGREHRGLESGADAVFVLSDGNANQWDFSAPGPTGMTAEQRIESERVWVPKQKTQITDPETGEVRDGPEVGGYWTGTGSHVVPPSPVPFTVPLAPYELLELFRQDLERLNLFRQAELNVIAVGERGPWWGAWRAFLKAVVAAGPGTLVQVPPEPESEAGEAHTPDDPLGRAKALEELLRRQREARRASGDDPGDLFGPDDAD